MPVPVLCHFTPAASFIVFCSNSTEGSKAYGTPPFRNQLFVERTPANRAGRRYARSSNTRGQPAHTGKAGSVPSDVIVPPALSGAGQDRAASDTPCFFLFFSGSARKLKFDGNRHARIERVQKRSMRFSP